MDKYTKRSSVLSIDRFRANKEIFSTACFGLAKSMLALPFSCNFELFKLKIDSRRVYYHRGVIFIKLAIALPLILISVFFFIFLSRYMLAKNSLKASIEKGIALGRTYGNPAFANRDDSISSLASEIDKFVKRESSLPNVFFLNPPSNDPLSTYSSLMSANKTQRGEFPHPNDVIHYPISGGLQGVHGTYLLAMAATYINLRASYGSAELKYPCSFSDLERIPGCLACYPFIYSLRKNGGRMIVPSPQHGLCLPDYDVFIECIWNPAPKSIYLLNNLIPGVTLFPPIMVRSSGHALCTPQIFANSPQRTQCSWCSM